MIINFKIFEILNYTNNIPLYKWGDYVLLDIDKIKKNLKKENVIYSIYKKCQKL